MRTACLILSFLLTFSHLPVAHAEWPSPPTELDALKAMFPSARFVEVSQAEYDLLLASAGGAHAVVLVDAPNEEPQAEPAPKTPEPASAVTQDHRPPPPDGAIVPARVRVSPGTARTPPVHAAVYGHGTGSVSTGDAAIILYVLVGVFVVGAALLYGVVIMYEMLSGNRIYEYWHDLAAGAWFFGGSGRRGGMYGARASIGIIGDFNRVGLVLEAGYLDGRFRFRDDDGFLSVSGVYGFLGPSVQWPLTDGPNPVSWDFEILTGYSSADSVGLMSRALTGFSWGLGSTWRMGIMAGSTYAKIRETEGPLNTKSDFNLTGGLHVGARF